MKQIWLDWLDKISMDWPISRRRFYGTEIPIWYCNQCKHPMVPKPGKYYQPWKDDPPFGACEKCKNTSFTGDVRTMDTWMDSSISALYIMKYPNNKLHDSLIDKTNNGYLVNIRAQGKDIVRTWLHYSMLRIHQLYDIPAFEHAWISGHVVHDSGEKMSKSKGNVTAPEPILDRYGGDALRLFGTMEASSGSDIRFSEERLRGGAKFLNKLYNIARFISSFPEPDNSFELTDTDKWILTELDKVIDSAMSGYREFDFHPAARTIRNFTVDKFASHYMEMVKNRAYNRDGLFSSELMNSARITLHRVLDTILKLMAPITPFITDFIYRELNERSIHLELFPQTSGIDQFDPEIAEMIMEFNRQIWKSKKDNNMSLRDPIEGIELVEALKPFEIDLVAMHNIN